MENFTSKLIREVGHLIHYQKEDYEINYPKNAEKYEIIGTLLRHMGTKGREDWTVEDLFKKDITIPLFINPDEVALINNFNAVLLVELVTTMQGKKEDNVFVESLMHVIEIHSEYLYE